MKDMSEFYACVKDAGAALGLKLDTGLDADFDEVHIFLPDGKRVTIDGEAIMATDKTAMTSLLEREIRAAMAVKT